MIKLVLITGFLGSGKTTLMQHILETTPQKIGIIVNEFGKISIDGKYLSQYSRNIYELNNGSIFCACIKDNFLVSLMEMAKLDIECLYIEASGLADPANMTTILETINNKSPNTYLYLGAICVIDAENFTELCEIFPAVERQIQYSGSALVNKVDLVPDAEVELIKQKIKEINPAISIYPTTHCQVDIAKMINELPTSGREAQETSNSIENRLPAYTLVSGEKLPYQALLSFLGVVARYAYRVKGYAYTDQGLMEINCVGKNINLIQRTDESTQTTLTVISAVGIRMMSVILEELKKELKKYIASGSLRFQKV